MTLATLQGMNFNMGDIANALKLKTAEPVTGGAQKAAEAAGTAAGTVAGAADAVRPKAAAKKSADGSQAKGGNGPARLRSIRCSGGARSRSSSRRSPPMR